jgi:hypothetical protein
MSVIRHFNCRASLSKLSIVMFCSAISSRWSDEAEMPKRRPNCA